MIKTFCAAMLCTGLLGGQAMAETVKKGDSQWSSEGQYMAYASPWCGMKEKSLLVERNFNNSISYKKGDLAPGRNVEMNWRWPGPERRSGMCGVFGYNHVAWGNYAGGAVRNPHIWLAETLTKLADGHPANSVGELMPWTNVG